MAEVTMAYWAYPIDFVNAGPEALLLYGAIEGTQRASSFEVTYDPGDAFKIQPGTEVTNQVRQVNEAALETADVVVAFVPRAIPSFGVPAEITQAALAGKPVLVVTDHASWAMPHDEPNVRIQVVSDWDWVVPGPALQDGLRWLRDAAEQAAATGTGRDLLLWRRATPAFPAGMGPQVLGPVAPGRAYPDDAGWDLTVSQSILIPPHSFVDVHLGVAVQLPSWSWGLLTGRSSTLRKRGLLVSQGVIDPGYRGPLYAGVWNLTDQGVYVEAGERIAQLIVVANGTLLTEAKEVESLGQHPRGLNGFGSSGA